MGNTILANNITAKARTGVWMVAKALNTVQSITDGGLYSPLAVHSFKVDNARFKKPGFDILYSRRGESWNRAVNAGSLFDSDMISTISKALGDPDREKSAQTFIDMVATEHINKFWGVYDLVLPFDIEHKLDHTGYKAAYFGSGDYAVRTVKGDAVFVAARGARNPKHPKKEYLVGLLNGEDLSNTPHTLADSKSLGVAQFQLRPSGVFTPGDDLEQPDVLKPRRLAGQLFETYADWHTADQTHGKMVSRYEKENKGKALKDWSRFPTLC
jgi:hypothetical protein